MTQFIVPRKKRRRAAKSYRKKSGVFATPAGFSIPSAGGTRASVLAAAAVMMAAAKANASKFSRRIPPATTVEPYSENEAMIVTDGGAAPNAAPFEFGERHPLWGNRNYWYKQPTRAYMNRAALSAAEAAAEIYAAIEADALAKEHGYN
jgi:hypothetical protein